MQSIVVNGITWYNSSTFEEQDLLVLQRKYHFHKLDIEDCLSEHERPKIEEYPGYIFCVFHVPVKAGGRIVKEEVNVFLGQDFIVTLHEGRTDVLEELWNVLHDSRTKREQYFHQGTGFFLYKLMDALFDRGFHLIETMVKELRRIEIELFEKEEHKINILRDILTLKRNIITMRSILFPQRAVIVLLQHKNKELIPKELDLYFDDVHDAVERQWSLLETAKEMSEALQDTHESWLTHKTNSIIRILTTFSVTMLPLTVITGLYGMNVPIPYQANPETFYLLLVGMLAIIASFFGYFMWKKWL